MSYPGRTKKEKERLYAFTHSLDIDSLRTKWMSVSKEVKRIRFYPKKKKRIWFNKINNSHLHKILYSIISQCLKKKSCSILSHLFSVLKYTEKIPEKKSIWRKRPSTMRKKFKITWTNHLYALTTTTSQFHNVIYVHTFTRSSVWIESPYLFARARNVVTIQNGAFTSICTRCIKIHNSELWYMDYLECIKYPIWTIGSQIRAWNPCLTIG